MPRPPRLDAPNTLHHGIVRGLERRAIFKDDTDRADFVARLAAVAEAGALIVLPWTPGNRGVSLRARRACGQLQRLGLFE
jgi:hypothetical protein